LQTRKGLNMARTATRPGSKKRVLTKLEAQAMAFQSQGSNPAGLKNVRSYMLRSALKFADMVNSTSSSLFGDVKKGANRWDTNMLSASGMPQGQAMIVRSIVMLFDTPKTGDSANPKTFDQDCINAFASWLRNSLHTFGREGAQWDAEFLGLEMGPSMLGMVNAPADAGAAAPVRLGDFVKTGAGLLEYKLRVPVVLGENSNFNYNVEMRNLLSATDPLVVNGEDVVVGLKGILTKVSAV